MVHGEAGTSCRTSRRGIFGPIRKKESRQILDNKKVTEGKMEDKVQGQCIFCLPPRPVWCFLHSEAIERGRKHGSLDGKERAGGACGRCRSQEPGARRGPGGRRERTMHLLPETLGLTG